MKAGSVPARAFPALALLGAKKLQVGTQDGFSTILPGRCGPVKRKKKRRGYLIGRLSSSARSKWAISWSVAASPPAVATSSGTMALRHFMDALLSKKATR